ncbi:MAG: hypothetical protein AAF939_09340 [Planctomycetota bacterium]
MNQIRSIGMTLFGGGLLCLLIAWDKYRSALETARLLVERLEGFELDSVAVPTTTWVMGFVGVVFTVAGLSCLIKWRSEQRSQSNSAQAMLPRN